MTVWEFIENTNDLSTLKKASGLLPSEMHLIYAIKSPATHDERLAAKDAILLKIKDLQNRAER